MAEPRKLNPMGGEKKPGVLTAISVFVIFSGSAQAVSPSAIVGKPAPAFDLEKADGGRISLASLKAFSAV